MRGLAIKLSDALRVPGRGTFDFDAGCLVVDAFLVGCFAIFCVNDKVGVGGLLW